MRYSLILATCFLVSYTAFAADNPATITPLFRSNVTASGQTIEVLPQPEVIVSRYEIAPGKELPVHKHPHARYAYILEGAITVTDVQSGKVFTSKAGDFIAEMRDTWHFGKNEGAVPVKILVIDQVQVGTKTNVIKKTEE